MTNNSVTAYGLVSVALGLSDFDDIVRFIGSRVAQPIRLG